MVDKVLVYPGADEVESDTGFPDDQCDAWEMSKSVCQICSRKGKGYCAAV
mgnify:CR=1 FL=1